MRPKRSGARHAAPILFALACVAVAASQPARAQQPTQLPPPAGSPIPRILPPAAPNVSRQAAPAPAIPPNQAPDTPTRVTAVTIDGATAFPQAELLAAVGNIVGPATTYRQIEAGRLALVRKYRGGGFPLVRVDTTVRDGQAHYTISEGHIAEVKLEGDRDAIGPGAAQVLAFLNRLTEATPLDAATLERYLLLAQDVPGMTIKAVLQPIDGQPGAIRLIAQVSRAEFSGLITADNRAFVNVGPLQVLGVLNLNSFTSFGEQTQLQLYGTPNFHGVFGGTEIFGQISTEFFLGASGLKLKIYAGAGDTTPGGDLALTNYEGRTIIFGTQASYPVVRTRLETLNVLGIFDSLQSTVLTNTPQTISSIDTFRVARLGVDYAKRDTWLGDSFPAVNIASLRLSRGLDFLSPSASNSSRVARRNTVINFTKFAGELSREQTLFEPYEGATISLYGLVSGQYTGDVLPQAEKFNLGGLRITRGFFAGQVTGDKALATTAELRLNTGFSTTLFGGSTDIGMQFYGFYDWGQTWENGPSVDRTNHRLASAGGGVRMTVSEYTEFDIEGVSRLTLHPQGGTQTNKVKAQAIYMRALFKF